MKTCLAALSRLTLLGALLFGLVPAQAAIEAYNFSLHTQDGIVGSGHVTFSDLAPNGSYYYQNGFADQALEAYILSGSASLSVPGYPDYTRTYHFLPWGFGVYNNMGITAEMQHGVLASMSFVGFTFDHYGGLGQDVAQLSIGPDHSFTFENRGSYNGTTWDFTTVGHVVYERIATPAPEPETLAMILAGLAGVSWQMRRQRRLQDRAQVA